MNATSRRSGIDHVCLMARLFRRRRSERGFLRGRAALDDSCRAWPLEAGSSGAGAGPVDVGVDVEVDITVVAACSVLRRRADPPLAAGRWEYVGAAIWTRGCGRGEEDGKCWGICLPTLCSMC